MGGRIKELLNSMDIFSIEACIYYTDPHETNEPTQMFMCI